MRLKYRVNIIRFRYINIILSTILALVGFSLPIMLNDWFPPKGGILPGWFLFLSATTGFIFARFLHEAYRFLIIKLLGLRAHLLILPLPKIYVIDGLGKWQAIGISLAPFTDLTLIGLLLLNIGSWSIIPLIVTFTAVNLMLSSRDIIEAFYLFKMVGSGEVVQKTPNGFKIWKI